MIAAIAILGPPPAAATERTANYRLTGLLNRTNWSSEASPAFLITTVAIGVEYGVSPTTGPGLLAAGSVVIPVSLVLVDGDDRSVADFSASGLSAGFAGRLGFGYGFEPIDRLRVMPALSWGFTASDYRHRFPGGSTSYTELTHGPGIEAEAGFRVTPDIWIEATYALRWERFQVAGRSTAPDDAYEGGWLHAWSVGVRGPRFW
ncbi:MAG: hypothetical protein EA382_04015 [Spirochaetaceae bacterium]|nr:MAG: hypothetical protein EA382_04015 [Spirochaetaceae bacterium]